MFGVCCKHFVFFHFHPLKARSPFDIFFSLHPKRIFFIENDREREREDLLSNDRLYNCEEEKLVLSLSDLVK